MEALQKNKNAVITVIIILILIVGGFMFTRGGADDSAADGTRDTVLPNVIALPTVDPSVEVTLELDAKGQEAILTIDNYPKGTNFIEYELSYDALVGGDPIPKGVIGTIEIEGKGPASKEITLGTCSSGVCKYDEGVEKVKVTLKFDGTYGAQLYENEFEL